MSFPNDLRYTRTHEWVKTEGDSLLIGLTDFAQKELGDIVFINVPFVEMALQPVYPLRMLNLSRRSAK